MNTKQLFLITIMTLLGWPLLKGQIFLTLEKQADSLTYLVKLRSDTTFKRPLSITNNIQCSFIVPNGGFKIHNLQNN